MGLSPRPGLAVFRLRSNVCGRQKHVGVTINIVVPFGAVARCFGGRKAARSLLLCQQLAGLYLCSLAPLTCLTPKKLLRMAFARRRNSNNKENCYDTKQVHIELQSFDTILRR